MHSCTFNVILIILTVHHVICEHSLAHLQCGKLTFILVSYLLNTQMIIPTFVSSVPPTLCQLKGRLYLSSVLIMDAKTRPRVLTNRMPMISRILTV